VKPFITSPQRSLPILYTEHFIDDPLLPGGDSFEDSAMAANDSNQDYAQRDSNHPDGKVTPTEFQEVVSDMPSSKHQPPPYVKSLSAEQREIAERTLVRKIDLRLLPMIILMYEYEIMHLSPPLTLILGIF